MAKEKFDSNRYISEYKKENYRRFEFHVKKKEEKNVIKHLENIKNRTAYIVDLIKKDMDDKF